MFCPYCRYENLEEAVFCESCGEQLPRKIVPQSRNGKKREYRVCPRCRATNQPQDRFCTSCGYEIRPVPQKKKAGAAAKKSDSPLRLDPNAEKKPVVIDRSASDSVKRTLQWYVDRRSLGHEKVLEIVTGILAAGMVVAVLALIVLPRYRQGMDPAPVQNESTASPVQTETEKPAARSKEEAEDDTGQETDQTTGLTAEQSTEPDTGQQTESAARQGSESETERNTKPEIG